jgi:hypothetical protein
MTSLLGLALSLLPGGEKPRVVYAGNQRLAAMVNEKLGTVADVTMAPNVRPSLEAEEIGTVRQRLEWCRPFARAGSPGWRNCATGPAAN